MAFSVFTPKAEAAIALRAAQGSNNAGGGTSITMTVPTGVQNGDVMIMGITVRGGTDTTITDPSGWTNLSAKNSTTILAQKLYWRVASSEPASYAVTITSNKASGVIIALSGADTIQPVITYFSGQNNASSQTVTAPALNSWVAANGIDVGFFGTATGTSFSPPTNYTEPANGESASTGAGAGSRTTSEIAYRALTGATTVGAISATAVDAAVNIGHHVFIKEDQTGILYNYTVAAATPQAAGVCSTGTNTVTAKDSHGSTITSDASTVNMTSSGTGVTFYTASGCATSTTQYTLSSGVASVYYKTNTAQSFTITATKASSVETGTSSSITVNPGSLNKYGVIAETTQGVDICSTGTNTITAQDQYSNSLTSDASVVNVTSSGTNVTFYTTSGCSTTTTQYTLASGTVTYYYKTSTAQTLTITATKNGASETGTSGSVTVSAIKIIRQEINILDSTITGSIASNSNEIIKLDTTKYNGTVTYYFEAVISGAASNTGTVTLRRNGTTTDDATLTGRVDATLTRTRSTAFTPPGGATEYIVRNNADGTRSQTIKAARIIIIQNAGTAITNTQTQIEIGHNITDGINNFPKYWTYNAANWDGTQTYSAEVTYYTNACAIIIKLQEDNGNWNFSDKVTIASGSSSLTLSPRVTFTPIDGRHYRLYSAPTSCPVGSYSIYNAKIIVDQNGEVGQDTNPSGVSPLNIKGGISGESDQAAGQTITPATAFTLTSVDLMVSQTGSPSDGLIINIRSGSADGTVIGQSSIIAGSSISSSFTVIKFIFSSPILLESGVTYYLTVERTGSHNLSIYYTIAFSSGAGEYLGGDALRKTTDFWEGIGVDNDIYFTLYKVSGSGITKLEPQYLLLNTADSGSTGLQSYMTLYDANEWAGVTTTLKASHDATNASDATKLVDITAAPDTDLTNGAVSGANQQIGASGITGLVDDSEIDVNVTNTTGVVNASRIIVVVGPAAEPTPTPTPAGASSPRLRINGGFRIRGGTRL